MNRNIKAEANWVAGAARAAIALALLGGANQVRAQASLPPPADTASDRQDASTIVVTGSRIRGIAPTGSNVIAVGQEALTMTGAVTPQDLINQVPQNVGTGFNEGTTLSPFGTVNSTRGGAVNLRGIGPQATLLLLDGHRLSSNGTSGTYLDPSAIPANALERIEVIADGASAIYGADAVAGVVNMILRRNVDGIEFSGRYGFAPGDLRQGAVGVVGGTKWDSGHIMLAYEYTYRSNLDGQARSYFRSDNRARGGSDLRASQCNPGTIQIGATTYPIPASNVTSATLVPGPVNRCDQSQFANILPEQKRHAIAATFSQELNEWMSIYIEGQAMWRDFKTKFVTTGGITENAAVVIPNTNPYFILPAGATATSYTVNYSFFPQYGPIVITGRERTYNIAAGFEFKLPSNWHATIGSVIGENNASTQNLAINVAALTAARASTNPATALNPFGPNSQSLLDGIFTGIFRPQGRNKISTAEVRADGPLFRLPGGVVRAAIGAEHSNTSYYGGTARGTTTVPTFTPTSTSRTVKSVYSEIFVPLFGADNAVAGAQSLALSGAVRYDKYSDVGSTTNTKFGMTWKPVDGLEFRGSYGTSFRAPVLIDTVVLKPGNLVSGVTRADPAAGNAQVPVIILVFGNPDVKPETAKTYSFGVTVEPRALPGFRANLNYFHLTYDGQIVSVLSDPTVLQRQAIFSSLIRKFTPALTPAQILADPVIASLIAQGGGTQNIQASQYIIDARPYNLGKTKTEGLDFDVSYRTALGGGTIYGGITGSYFFNFQVQQTPTAPTIDQLNNFNYALRLKSRASLGWTSKTIDAAAYVNYVNPYNNPSSTVHPRVGTFTTVDLHVGIGLPIGDSRISLDVTNLFDRAPPFVDIDGGYDTTQANAVGRLISLSLRSKF